jgi:cellobiose-specific phosphotransferase system component IIA
MRSIFVYISVATLFLVASNNAMENENNHTMEVADEEIEFGQERFSRNELYIEKVTYAGGRINLYDDPEFVQIEVKDSVIKPIVCLLNMASKVHEHTSDTPEQNYIKTKSHKEIWSEENKRDLSTTNLCHIQFEDAKQRENFKTTILLLCNAQETLETSYDLKKRLKELITFHKAYQKIDSKILLSEELNEKEIRKKLENITQLFEEYKKVVKLSESATQTSNNHSTSLTSDTTLRDISHGQEHFSRSTGFVDLKIIGPAVLLLFLGLVIDQTFF